jgi:hypothetical protein
MKIDVEVEVRDVCFVDKVVKRRLERDGRG